MSGWKFKLMILCSLFMLAATSDESKEVVISFKPESTISIHGSSNVNSFDFVQKDAFIAPNIKILYNKNVQGLLTNIVYLPVKVSKFTCSNHKMLSDFLEILNADKHPIMGISLYKINIITKKENYDKIIYSGNVDVSIALSGITSLYTIPFDAISESGKIIIIGEKILKFTDFNLNPPVKFMGMVKVKNELHVQLKIVLQIQPPRQFTENK